MDLIKTIDTEFCFVLLLHGWLSRQPSSPIDVSDQLPLASAQLWVAHMELNACQDRSQMFPL